VWGERWDLCRSSRRYEAPESVITDATTREDAASTHRWFGSLDGRPIGGRRWRGRSPWERHLDSEELPIPLEGSYEVALLTDDGKQRVDVSAGSMLVIPRGVWDRLYAAETVLSFAANATGSTDISFADDPRAES
jgi:mannose-6-phosphate isomerase-like protein (cupin superfamily)